MSSRTAAMSQPTVPDLWGSASELLLHEYIHRAANDFAAACAEVSLASRSSLLAGQLDVFDRITVRLGALASLQRLLQPPQEERFDLSERLCELCRHQAEARFAEKGANVVLRTCDVQIDARRGWPLLLIVSELLTNASRHAGLGPGGLVTVNLAEADDEIICLVHDDGVGCSLEQPALLGGGASLVSRLAQAAGMMFSVPPRPIGSAFELRLRPGIQPVQQRG